MEELGQVGGSPLEGKASQGNFGSTNVQSRIVADQKTLKDFQKTLEEIGETAKKLETKFDSLFKKTKDLTSALKDVQSEGGMGGAGSYIKKGDMPEASKLSKFTTKVLGGITGGGGEGGGGGYAAMFKGIMGAGGGGGGAGAAGAAGGFAAAAGMAIRGAGVAMEGMDSRINQNLPYALSADRLGLVYQQTTGMSGGQYRSQVRRPLTQYRLGAEGMNPLLSPEARYGINSQLMAPSVEALRTVTGFGYDSQQMANMVQSMASPTTANRMFLTMGTGIYGIGGRQKSPMQVFQDITRRMGLNDEEVLKGAMQQGSTVRQRLANAGLDEDMQTMLLQYAQSNVTYQRKGGKGMYDPSKKGQRRLMGIEDTYASQQEETTRVQAEREERMYSRQVDNYAEMEKRLQSVNKLLGEFEDRLSGIIGAYAQNRPLINFGKGIFSTVKRIVGFGDGLPSNMIGTRAATLAGMSLSQSMETFRSSGVSSGFGGTETYGSTSSTNYSVSTSSAPLSAKTTAQMTGLNSTFKERLSRMMQDRPSLGLGSLIRSYEEQKGMFLGRYERTNKETNIFWDGSYWEKKNDGSLPAAPPGMSYHERGLAADLVGSQEDLEWMWKNASKYGLKAFGTKDPPHVELAESLIPSNLKVDWSNPKKNDQGGGGAVSKYSDNQKGNKKKSYAPKHLSGPQVAKFLYDAGFRGKDLVTAVGIAQRESKFNINAHNPDGSTNDDSYGLMQINMLGNLGPWRRKKFGIGSNEELFDPATNARAAYWLWKEGNGGTTKKTFYHWGEYKGQSATANTNLKAAKNHVISAGYPAGDGGAAAPPAQRQSTSTASSSSGGTINVNIAPTINLSGTGNYNMDIRQVAREVSQLFEKEIRLALMRSS